MMMQLINMAWRNLGRHRGRTYLSLLAVFVGVLVVILFKGFIDGMIDTMSDLNINLNSGHVRIIQPEYQVKERLLSLSYPIGEGNKSYSAMIKEIRNLPGIKYAMGRIRFGMVLVSGEEHQTVTGIGAEIATENKVSQLSRFLEGKGSGRLPQPGKSEILLGMDLMTKMHLKVGDKVNAVFPTSLGSFNIATFKIVGKMASGLKMLDEASAYIPLDRAMNFLELPDMVTEIVVFGSNTGQTGTISREIQNYLTLGKENLKVIPWYQYNDLISFMQKEKAVLSVFYAMMLLLASFVVFNTLMMVVSERSREIGMLSSLGMTPRDIKQLFLYEGLFIAIIGSLAGTISGGALNWLMSQTGIDISSTMGMLPKDLTIMPKLYPSYNASVLLFSFVMGIIVTMLAAYLPARRAALLKPTEALRTI